MSEATVARDYDRWLTGGSLSGLIYGTLSSLPGTVLVNTPAFRLHTELQIRRDQRVLDIGCGRGSLLQTLSARVAFSRLPVGIDVSRAMLPLGVDDLTIAPHDVALL